MRRCNCYPLHDNCPQDINLSEPYISLLYSLYIDDSWASLWQLSPYIGGLQYIVTAYDSVSGLPLCRVQCSQVVTTTNAAPTVNNSLSSVLYFFTGMNFSWELPPYWVQDDLTPVGQLLLSPTGTYVRTHARARIFGMHDLGYCRLLRG